MSTSALTRPDRARRIAGDENRARSIADMLKAVAHPLRLRIVAILCGGEQTVGSLVEQLDAPQAIVSQQLRILRVHRLVDVERREGFAFYRLLEPRLRQLVNCVEGCRTH